jgi:hypothetical protein
MVCSDGQSLALMCKIRYLFWDGVQLLTLSFIVPLTRTQIWVPNCSRRETCVLRRYPAHSNTRDIWRLLRAKLELKCDIFTVILPRIKPGKNKYNSDAKSPFWEANTQFVRQSKKAPHYMKSQSSYPCSQQPTTYPNLIQTNAVHALPIYFLEIILVFSNSGLFVPIRPRISGFHTHILYTLPFPQRSHIHYRILLDLITRIVFGEPQNHEKLYYETVS